MLAALVRGSHPSLAPAIETDERAARRTLRDQIAPLEGELAHLFCTWELISNADIGEPGCKHWHVRPRYGVLGMFLNWWRVRISSGCPLAGGRGQRP